jgi:Ser/Thr protein kinase RdoA (MazF antagonist)
MTVGIVPNHNDWRRPNLKWDGSRLTGLLDFGTLAIGTRFIDIANAVKFWWGVYGGADESVLAAYADGYKTQAAAHDLPRIKETEAAGLKLLILDNIAQKVWYSLDRMARNAEKPGDPGIVEQECPVIRHVLESNDQFLTHLAGP